MGPSVPPIGPTRYHRLSLVLGAAIAIIATAGCSADDGLQASLTASTQIDGSPIDPPGVTVTAGAAEAGASGDEPAAATTASTLTATTTGGSPADGPTTTGTPSTDPPAAGTGAASAAPDWLGTRTLPTTPDGAVVVPQTTPEELRQRRIVTTGLLDPPPDGRFRATIEPLSQAVLDRSTWEPGCPVEPEDLSYLTLSFWGFDDRAHTGELIVHREVATDIVGVFDELFEARFPIEEMRIVTAEDLAAPPTGDGNNTAAFVCRPITGGTSFSEHAYGLAIDINPFHNPYERGDLVLPELAGHYLDRGLGQAGMVIAGDVAVQAFAEIGWSWGGDWTSLKDYQHFSRSGR